MRETEHLKEDDSVIKALMAAKRRSLEKDTRTIRGRADLRVLARMRIF
jgi:hypothetical protein